MAATAGPGGTVPHDVPHNVPDDDPHKDIVNLFSLLIDFVILYQSQDSPTYLIVKRYSANNLFFGRMPFGNTADQFERAIGIIALAAIISYHLRSI